MGPGDQPRVVANGHAVTREAAFDRLFHTHYGALCRFAARVLGGMPEAEEVVQDVFLYVWDRHDFIDDTAPSRAYLYRAVHNAALNRLRHRKVEDRWAEGLGKPEEESASPHILETLEHEELVQAVHRAVAALPPRMRLVYTLSRQDQLTNAEIASTLGLSIKTVETQMTRAFRQLRLTLAGTITGLFLLFR